MGMKRTTGYADTGDLAVIKTAAARRGVAEAELIREAIHLAAMANRVWDEPFFRDVHVPAARSAGGAQEALCATWDEKATAYEETKKSTT